MKKTILVFAGFILSAAAFSQVSLGVQGIGNLSNASIKTEDMLNPSKKASALPGAGLVAQFDLGKNVAIRTGVNYLQHGFKLKGSFDEDFGEDVSSVIFNTKTNLNYVQVPVNILYKVPSRLFDFYIGGGPYVSYGVSGKIKITSTINYENGDKEIETEEQKAFTKEGGDEAGLKRSDIGVGAIAGFKFTNGLFANVGYQLNLSNSSGDSEGKYKNRGLQLTIGYFLWNK